MKRCSRCQTIKPLAEFMAAPTRPDGATAYCETCAETWARLLTSGRDIILPYTWTPEEATA